MRTHSRQFTYEPTFSVWNRGCLLAVLMLIVANFALSTDVRAAVITLNLRTFGPATSAPNTWELFAQTSVGDNDGISGYNIPVLGALSLDHNLIGQEIGGVLTNGFIFNDDAGDVIFGGMDLDRLTAIYGVGNAGFVVPMPPSGFTNVGMPGVGDPFAPVLLASGTGDWLTVDVGDIPPGHLSANVWALGDSLNTGTPDADRATVMVVRERSNTPVGVPEPATLLLLGLGLAGLGFARKRLH